MDIQFQKTQISCLKQILSQIQDLELTQEIKLPDGMPDIGCVIGTWGQVLLRSKQWQGDRVGAAGGIQVWILYAAEDGSGPKMLEEWIPFQSQWDIPDGMVEGKLCILPRLRVLDARSVAARRVLVRGSVSLLIKAVIPDQAEVFSPGELPSDVQLLTNDYPVTIPVEAGEKVFVLDEEIPLSPEKEKPEKLMRYSLEPEITEVKVMSGRLVFRGNAYVSVLCRGGEKIFSIPVSVPFAQYEELEGEYDPDASAWIFPVLTSLEVELEEDKLRLKAGVACQYVICEQKILPLVEDAYSTRRELKLCKEALSLPVILQQQQIPHQAQCPWHEDGQVVDVMFYPDHPRQMRNAELVEHQLSGRFHVLYYDVEGVLRGSVCKWESQIPMQTHENGHSMAYGAVTGEPMTSGVQLQLNMVTASDQGLSGVCALTLGENTEKTADRPSLILRKAGEDGLWQLAKATGSTEQAIRHANKLEANDPDPDRILLIPVL